MALPTGQNPYLDCCLNTPSDVCIFALSRDFDETFGKQRRVCFGLISLSPLFFIHMDAGLKCGNGSRDSF